MSAEPANDTNKKIEIWTQAHAEEAWRMLDLMVWGTETGHPRAEAASSEEAFRASLSLLCTWGDEADRVVRRVRVTVLKQAFRAWEDADRRAECAWASFREASRINAARYELAKLKKAWRDHVSEAIKAFRFVEDLSGLAPHHLRLAARALGVDLGLP